MNRKRNYSKPSRNPVAQILKCQKFIITEINDSNGTTETHCKRNPNYQWNLFNPFIRAFLHNKAHRKRRQIKKPSQTIWIEEKNGEFVAVLEKTGEIIETGATFEDVAEKTIYKDINDPDPNILYSLRSPPLPYGEIFIPSFWDKD